MSGSGGAVYVEAGNVEAGNVEVRPISFPELVDPSGVRDI